MTRNEMLLDISASLKKTKKKPQKNKIQ